MSEKLPKYVTSCSKLADLLGVHRHTIATWLKQAGAPQHGPKGYPVRSWLNFAAQIAKRAKTTRTNPKAQLEMEKLSETVRGLKLKNDEDAGLLIRLDVVRSRIHVLGSELKADIRSIADQLPHILQGIGPGERKAVISRRFDETIALVSRRAEDIA